LAKGGSGEVVQSNGTDVIYDDVAWANVKKVGSDLDDLATKNHNDLDNIGEDDHHDKTHALDSTTEHSALSNNTNHDVSITKHGFCPILPDDDTLYLDGQGNFTEPAGGGGGGGAYFNPDKFPVGYAAQSDHFDNNSIDVKWVDFNVTAGTSFAEADHHLKMTKTTNENNIYRGKYQTLPSGNFTITMKLGMITTAPNYHQVALILFEDATNNPTTCDLEMFVWYTLAGVLRNWAVQYWPAYNTYGGSDAGSPRPDYNAHSIYFRIRQNSTTWYFDLSLDGVTWELRFSMARRFTPAEFGFGLCNNTAVTQYVWIDWILYQASDNILPTGGV
jgi:hypothetical protein